MYAETSKICRLCLSEGQSLINLFRRNGRSSEEVKLISDLLQFEVSYNDGYPRFVCCTCREKLTNFNSFKNNCTNLKKRFDKNYALLKDCRITLTQLETGKSVKHEIEEEIEVTVRSEDGTEILEDPLRLTIPLDNQDGMDVLEDPLKVTTPYVHKDDMEILEDPLKVTTPYDNQDAMDILEDPLKVRTPYDNQLESELMDIKKEIKEDEEIARTEDGLDILEDPLKVTTPYDNQDSASSSCRGSSASISSACISSTYGGHSSPRSVKLCPPSQASSQEAINSVPESIKEGISGSSSSAVPSINSSDREKAVQYFAETSNEKTENKKIGSTAPASTSVLKPVSSQPAIAAIIYKTPPVPLGKVHTNPQTGGTLVDVSIAIRHQTIDAVTLNIQRPRVIENAQGRRTEVKNDLKTTEANDDLSEGTKETKKELSAMDIDDEDTLSAKDFTLEVSGSKTESQSSSSSDEETSGSSHMEKKTIIECKSSKSPKPGYSTSKREIAPSDKKELKNLKMSKSKAIKIMQARIDKIFTYSHTITRRTSFACDECDKTFPKTRLLADHKKEHGRDIPFECITCRRRFKKYYRWFEHLKSHSKGKQNKLKEKTGRGDQGTTVQNKSFQCDKCDISFDNSLSFDDHMKEHENSIPYKCLVCGREFMKVLRWKAHIKFHGEKKFSCSKCPFRSYSMYGLKKHFRKHTGEKPYQCKICQKSYSCKTILISHMLTHENRAAYECDICHKTFTLKHQVKMHMLIHTNPKKLTCEECGKLCLNIYGLEIHKQIHSSTPGFLCNKCGKTFFTNGQLKLHLIVHSDRKPFACDRCDKTFNRKDNLKLHKSVHSENKAFMCDKCGKCFSRKVYLKYHKRIHERDNDKVQV